MIFGSLAMLLFFAVWIFGVFGAVDAAVRPFAHWQATGHSKAAWIVGQLLALIPIVGLAGLVVAIVYLTRVRPELKAVADQLTP